MQKYTFSILLSGLFLLCTSTSWAYPLKQCESVFLKGKTVEDYIKIEEALPERERDQKYLSRLKGILKSKDCNKLLEFAALKDNGLLIDRTLIASDLLESFNDFHYRWIMPKDLDRSATCVDKYEWDIFDRKSPAYHLTRALFQKSRKASQVLTAYGESRIVRKGEDPSVSPKTQVKGEDYKTALKLERDITFPGTGEILGFLFERATDSSQFALPTRNRTQWEKKMPFQTEHNIYQHFGAGLLGSPSYLYYHLKKKAFFAADGTRSMARNLANSIFENLLCSNPDQFNTPEKLNEFLQAFTPQKNQDGETVESALWNHPITKESSCLECHYPLDQMAAGFRNLTLIPSAKSCTGSRIQILYPVFLKSDHTQQIWTQSDTTDNEDFSSSYGVGHFNGKRFRTIRELGHLISDDIHFYSCQVKHYYQWIHHSYPEAKVVEKLAKNYKQSQDGLSLIRDILNEAPSQKEIKKKQGSEN